MNTWNKIASQPRFEVNRFQLKKKKKLKTEEKKYPQQTSDNTYPA